MERDVVMTMAQCVKVAKALTDIYARTHKGRNALERECIAKGYLVRRPCDVFTGEKDERLRLFAMDFNGMTRRGGLVMMR